MPFLPFVKIICLSLEAGTHHLLRLRGQGNRVDHGRDHALQKELELRVLVTRVDLGDQVVEMSMTSFFLSLPDIFLIFCA